MDSLTHTVLGACLGEAIAGKKLGKKAMLAGAIVNNLPDADVIVQALSSPAEGLLAHRGITHSILVNAVLTVLIAYLFRRWFSKQELSMKESLLLAGSGLFLHIFLDSLTSYGTGWFEPFSHARVSLNCLFILDPFLLLPLLVSAIALLILKRTSTRRRPWSIISLSICLAYLLITFGIKAYVNGVIRKDLDRQQIACSDYMTSPGPLNNLLWYSVVNSNDSCYVGYYSILDEAPTVAYEAFAKNDALLAPYSQSDEVRRLIRFSQGYYCVVRTDSSLVFNDIRFGQLGGWYKKQAPFVFSFDILGHNDAAHLQQSRMKNFEPDVLRQLYIRTKGKKQP